MGRLLREPIIHFLLGAAALFLLYDAVSGDTAERRERIVVDEARVASLVARFERLWMRAPTPEELESLVDDFVKEEVLYREALALGLDRDDLVVRRRMRQKMEFLNEGLADREPTEEELRGFVAANPDRFRAASRVTLEQVFVKAAVNGAAQERAAVFLERLRQGENPDGMGDPTLLPCQLIRATPTEVARTFGEAFAEALAEVPEDSWSGPIVSSFGTHLVRVSAREHAGQRPFDEVRTEAEREWAAEQRNRARKEFHRALRARYDVELRLPAVMLPREASRT